MVTARFTSEAALRKVAEGAWGPPDVDARWDFWYADPSGVRAAFTGCHDDSATSQRCKLEWMPFRPVERLLATEVFPDGRTWIGQPAASLPLGPSEGRDTTTRYKLRPSRADLWVPVEVQHTPARTVGAYRLPLSYTYDSGEEARIWAALTALLGELSADGSCKLGRLGAVPVRACPAPMQVVLTVGTWE